MQIPPIMNGIQADCVDELRFYDRELSATEVQDRYKNGRFVKHGTYTSPLYVLDSPTRMLTAQWEGLTPHWFECADHHGEPLDPFTVQVEGFSSATGDPASSTGTVRLGDWDPAAPHAGAHTLDDSKEVYDLTSLGIVRSFRYTVGFDCSKVKIDLGSVPQKVLDDTPVFQSISFAYARQGHAPAWSGWTTQ